MLVLQWDKFSGQEMESSESVVRRWHSAKAVLLLLREELQQMREFIDRLRVRRLQCKSSADLNDLGLDCRVQCGPSGLDNIDGALRVVCDRLDALGIVSDVVLADRAAELFDTGRHEVPGCWTGSDFDNEEVLKSTMQGEHSGGETITLETENRQLFDQIVDMIRQVDETNIVRHSHSTHDLATPDSHCQMPRTERIESNECSEDLTDMDRASDSTEANSSNESSYTTCNGSNSPGSASANARRQSILEEMSPNCASNDNKAQIFSSSKLTDENPEPVKDEINKCSKLHAKLPENAGVFSSAEQSHRSALELLRNEQTLLQLQQRTNVVLHRELVQLSDDNRKLQSIIAELETFMDRKNNEVVTLKNKADRISRLLDEQVEEFKCVFRADTRENDEELERLTTENSKLRSALASRDTSDGFGAKESTEKKLQGDGASAHELTYAPFIREHLVRVIPQQMQTEDGLNEGKSNGISRETENEVSSLQRFDDASCPNGTKPDKFIRSLALDCRGSDAHIVVPMDPSSENRAVKRTMFEDHCLAQDSEERCVPATNWNDCGFITHCDTSVCGVRETDGLELNAHLPLDNRAPTVGLSFHDASSISRSGRYLETHHEEMKNKENQTKKKSTLGRNGTINKVSRPMSRINSVHATTSFTDADLQALRVPDVKLSWPRQTNRLSRSVSDSCLLSQLCGTYSRYLFSRCDLDDPCEMHESQYHPCSTNYLQQHYQKHEINTRSAATQTKWQETNITDSHADAQPEEDEPEMFQQDCRALDNDNSSVKSDLQRLQEIVIRDDFAIIQEYRVEDFSSSDMQFIVAHFKHHIEQKVVLSEENRLLVEEIGRLLTELLELRGKLGYAHLPVITEGSSIDVDSKVSKKQEGKKRHMPVLKSTSMQNTEDCRDQHNCNHRLPECSSSTEIAVYSRSKDVDIPAQTSVSSDDKQLQNGHEVETELPQNVYVFDEQLDNFDSSFVPNSRVLARATEISSRSRSPNAAFSYICPLPFSRTEEHLSLTDLVRQLRRQNARLASCLSVVESFSRQSHYNRTFARHNDRQLQLTVPGHQPAFTAAASVHHKHHRDCSETVSPVFLPTHSSLSVVYLERPLVIDLSTERALGVVVEDFSSEDSDKNSRPE